MQPRIEGAQRCLSFELSLSPKARVTSYRDYLGNIVHHFDIPGRHSKLTLTAEAHVECTPPAPLPYTLGDDPWGRLDALVEEGSLWEYVSPSAFARPTPRLLELSRELALDRSTDPLVLTKRLPLGSR